MHPIICQIGPFAVYSYGLLLVLAFFTATFLAQRKALTLGVNPQIIFDITFAALVAGIIGGRLFYVLTHLNYYINEPLSILKLWEGGLSWFGGLLSGFIVASIYIKRNKLKVVKILDLLAPFLALAHSIGRIGCLLNGCCYGIESRWGIYFPVHNKILVPTQLYSSLALLAIFIILRVIQDRPHKNGEIILSYLIFYSVWRFIIEFWRAEESAVLWGLTRFQLISLVVLIISLFIAIKKTKNNAQTQ